MIIAKKAALKAEIRCLSSNFLSWKLRPIEFYLISISDKEIGDNICKSDEMTKALNGTCRLVAAFTEVLFQFRHSGECAVVPCQKYYRAAMIPCLNNCGKL
jgi:hypothetical protein